MAGLHSHPKPWPPRGDSQPCPPPLNLLGVGLQGLASAVSPGTCVTAPKITLPHQRQNTCSLRQAVLRLVWLKMHLPRQHGPHPTSTHTTSLPFKRKTNRSSLQTPAREQGLGSKSPRAPTEGQRTPGRCLEREPLSCTPGWAPRRSVLLGGAAPGDSDLPARETTSPFYHRPPPATETHQELMVLGTDRCGTLVS